MEINTENTEDLYEHQQIKVDSGQEPLRIDKFLMNRIERVTRNKVQLAIRVGNVLVNKKEIKPNYRVRPNDVISILLSTERDVDGKVEPENIPLNVVYEDEYLLVVNKPAGMVVHPGFGNKTGTLVNALAYYLQREDIPILPGNRSDRPGLVHRLDKQTSGLMVIAKEEYTLSHLAKQFFDRTIERSYSALVWGTFDQEKGTVNEYIGRHPRNRLLMTVYEDQSAGKNATTHYEVLEDFYYVSLIRCQLETGRTHQIRVHMKYLKHPVFADDKYDGARIVKGTVHGKYKKFVENCFKLCGRQALHAKSIGFQHPKTNEKMKFESELPDDFAKVLVKWREYFETRKEK